MEIFLKNYVVLVLDSSDTNDDSDSQSPLPLNEDWDSGIWLPWPLGTIYRNEQKNNIHTK